MYAFNVLFCSTFICFKIIFFKIPLLKTYLLCNFILVQYRNFIMYAYFKIFKHKILQEITSEENCK